MPTPTRSIIPETTPVLPESYTLETGSGILQRQGIIFRHKDLAAELTTSQSIYKQLLQLPALIIYNQSLVDRAKNANEYLQEQIINIIFAVNEVRAKQPENQKPLSARRTEEYNTIQATTYNTSEALFELEKIHHTLKENMYTRLKSQLREWKDLCREAADTLTDALVKEGLQLPDNFQDILSKHLQRAGTNKIHPDELKEFNLKEKLSYAEQALVCALKEVNYNA